ncbi:MAG: RsmE family RNA methyltransferase [Kiritimatiellia bacterium]|jgi:16S rRNA (uracil1498-N3)-methyltransferase|nr:RsmE family RNA methyltransferase [Kiritimatiellia bacterium]MDP6631020.1 RsmE family RNA methyltransferase [Kiritimatiellia bacterium]MDP6809976.1 RsmE family RNA methyltransferase [Kiritimatiellia bacterium]MDP7024747.1 RsmE family RNA methyltransferase [Kiritimatiellia bacterium]
MHRCYLAPGRWQDGVLVPGKDEAHHLRDVLRVTCGDVIAVFDGAGRRVEARVVALTSQAVDLEPIGPIATIPRSKPVISLLQAIPKGSRMDTVVEKGTELGMDRLVPVITERTITRLDEAKGRKRCERWTRVAHGAARQCGACWIPEIAPVQSLTEALAARPEGDILLVGALSGTPRPMAEVVDEVAASRPPSVSLLIGPEGDLTPAETEAATAVGAIGISMGPLVLRTDTAPLFGLSVLASRLR